MIGCLPTQALAFLTVFVYATHTTQAIAFECKPGLSVHCLCVCSSAEPVDTPVNRGSHSRTWLQRPLVSDDRSQLERHLVSEQCKRQQLEETVSLLLHQQHQHHQHQPSLATVSTEHCREY